MAIDLRCFTYVDILQPQTASFLATISKGYHPLKNQASLFIEVSPGMDINIVTDIALKRTSCTPGMQIVERRYGVLELHHYDQGQVRAAGEEILSASVSGHVVFVLHGQVRCDLDPSPKAAVADAASGPPGAPCDSAAGGRTLAPTGAAGAGAPRLPRLVLRTPALEQGICAFFSCLSGAWRGTLIIHGTFEVQFVSLGRKA